MITTNNIMKNASIALLAAMLMSAAPEALLAQCAGGVENPSIDSATPSDAFLDRPDGTVLHRPSQLIWQRCPLGQNWTGSSCDGSATLMDWESALLAADSHGQANHEDWRLPNRNELASIVETRCHSPAINGEVFPATPIDWFWTSSPVSEQSDQVWVVLFADGELQPAATTGQYAARLVRAGRQ